MSTSYEETDIQTLSKLHHELYYKSLHSDFEKQYPMLKDVSPLETGVLSMLSENPGAMLKEIAENLAIPKSTLTTVVDRLEKRKYVCRVISTRDRRSFELVLTENGKIAQQQHLDSERDLYIKILDALGSKTDIENFTKLVRKVANYF